MSPFLIPKGTRFGHYVTTGATPVPIAGNNHWEVRCVCGTVKLCKGANLRSGRSNSCGCQAKGRPPGKPSRPAAPRKPREVKAPEPPPEVKLPTPEPAELTPPMKLALAMRKSGARWSAVLEVTGLTQHQVETNTP